MPPRRQYREIAGVMSMRCNWCGEFWPLDDTYFPFHKKRQEYFGPCKTCSARRVREKRAAWTPEQREAYNASHRVKRQIPEHKARLTANERRYELHKVLKEHGYGYKRLRKTGK